MNYLAHLFLAEQTPLSLLGNLAGDFVKGPLGDRFAPEIAAGIRQHRRIDAFTDAHPQVAAFRRVLIPEHGHYARVIADVFFDHFLAVDFASWSSESLPAFVERVSALLDQQVDHMPPRLRAIWPRMRDQQWLLSYQEVDSVRMALYGISRRLSRQPDLATASHHLTGPSRPELERRFRAFLPDVLAFALPSAERERRRKMANENNATGTWKSATEGDTAVELVLTQDGSSVSGKATITIVQRHKWTCSVSGTAQGNSVKLTGRFPNGDKFDFDGIYNPPPNTLLAEGVVFRRS